MIEDLPYGKRQTSAAIPGQLPDFVRNESSRFVDFLKAYYDFLDGYNLNLKIVKDVDDTTDPLLMFIKREVAKSFPKAAVSDRVLIKTVRDIYSSKGSVDSLKLLFRVLFNEYIDILVPNESVLIASDGRWSQLSSIRVRRDFGSFPEDSSVFTLTNDKGVFRVNIERYEVQDVDHVLIFFNVGNRIDIDPEGTNFVSIRNESGSVVYRGEPIKHPNRISISSPGKFWKRGQVFRFPGTEVDTIVRVKRVNNNGGIESLEIVRRGNEHTQDQLLVISPFPNRPAEENITVTPTIIGIDGGGNPIYDYDVRITESLEDIFESFLLIMADFSADSYFFSYVNPADLYTTDDYNGRIEVEQSSSTSAVVSTGPILVDPSLTNEMWLESRAFLTFTYDYIFKELGEYLDTKGQLSNDTIKLQDSYFYQLFSYVISSTIDIAKYRDIVNIIHPAGLKMFGNLQKTVGFETEHAVRSVQPRMHTYPSDTVTVTDSISFEIITEI